MTGYDEDEHAKETFAHFGRAYYMSNVFETGLALAILQLDFLIDIKTRSQQEGWKPITRKQYEEKLEEFLKKTTCTNSGKLDKKRSKTSTSTRCISENRIRSEKTKGLSCTSLF